MKIGYLYKFQCDACDRVEIAAPSTEANQWDPPVPDDWFSGVVTIRYNLKDNPTVQLDLCPACSQVRIDDVLEQVLRKYQEQRGKNGS